MKQPVLAVGPANYAGQAHQWARAVAKNLNIKTWSFMEISPSMSRKFPVDKEFPFWVFRNPLFRGIRLKRLFSGTTHIALDGFKGIFSVDPYKRFSATTQQIVNSGYKLALIAHGTEVRRPNEHLARNPWSHFKEGDQQWRDGLQIVADRNCKLVEDSQFPVFYSTPDLGLDLPSGTWLPVTVDIDYWASDKPIFERKIPRVLHLPSTRNPPIKGSQYIDKIMRELHDKKIVEYVAPGTVPSAEMKNLVTSCDVVVDQILIGSYGVAAVEAMAARRIVVGGMPEYVQELMPEYPGIIDANPTNFKEVMLSLLERRDEMQALANKNLAFVRRWHDGTVSATRLAPFLGIDLIKANN